jgi:hypothetical protein
MIERYKRMDAKTLELDMTIDDPGAAAYFRRHPRLFIYFQARWRYGYLPEGCDEAGASNAST